MNKWWKDKGDIFETWLFWIPYDRYLEFTGEPVSERSLKIGLHSQKFWPKNQICYFFHEHGTVQVQWHNTELSGDTKIMYSKES